MLTIKNWVGNGCVVLLALATFLTGCTPPGPRALLAGKRLLEEGHYAQAIDQFKTATTLMKTNALAWSYLGLACQQAGQAAEAERAYLQALVFDRDLAEAHYNLACLWLAQNRLDAAKGALTAYTLRRSDSAEGFVKLGTAQLRLRELTSAERSFAEALRLQPEQPEALNGLGLARVQRGMYRDAMIFFEHALKRQPNYRPALLNQGIVAQFYLRDRALALQKYRAYLALKPAPAEAEAVAAYERQLQQELAPPARPAVTNLAGAAPLAVNPQVVTNVARPAPTNTPPVRIASVPKPEPSTSPPPTHVASAPKPEPVVSSPPKPSVPVLAPPATNQHPPKPAPTQVATPPPPAPKLEPAKPPVKTDVVRLGPEPVVKPVRDVASAPPPTHPPVAAVTTTSTAPARPVAPPATNLVQASPSPTGTTAAPVAAASDKPSKHGLLHSINPLNLLRTDEKPAPRVTPLPTLPSDSPTGVTGAPAESTVSSTVPAAPGPTVPRYAYRAPAQLPPGNRASATPLFTQGLQAQQARRYADAIRAYRAATQEDPGFFEAYYNLGLVSTTATNLPTALAAYERALIIQPDSFDSRYNFGLVLQQANYPLDAALELEKALAHRPNDPRVHLVLGNLYAHSLHQPAKAREHYARVLELEARHPQAGAIRFWLAANPP